MTRWPEPVSITLQIDTFGTGRINFMLLRWFTISNDTSEIFSTSESLSSPGDIIFVVKSLVRARRGTVGCSDYHPGGSGGPHHSESGALTRRARVQ